MNSTKLGQEASQGTHDATAKCCMSSQCGLGPPVPVGQPRNHHLAKYVRSVTYQESGRATAAMVTVIMPGVGASGLFQGLGLSIANETDRFSRSEGRRIALLRALDNVADHL